MKKVILFSFVLIGLNCFSQTKNKTTASNYFNKIIWSQVFNNFEVHVTIPFVSPWVIGMMNFNYIDNNVFTKNILKEDEIFTENDIIFKEVLNSIPVGFLNYVPTDSTMIIRALYKNRLLYTLELHQSDSIISIDYKLPDNELGESVIFDKRGNLKSQVSYHSGNKTEVTNESVSDSLFICATDNELKDYTLIEENLYRNSNIINKKAFKENKTTKKRKFISNNSFQYNDRYQLSKILNLDKKGEALDSIEYFYQNDTLTAIKQEKYHLTTNFILYNYKNGLPYQTNIRKKDFSIQLTKSYDQNKISQIEYTDIQLRQAEQYDFAYNKQGFLNSVLFKSTFNTDTEFKFDQQCLYTYNKNNNLQSIKVVDKNGVIKKEINYEYDYK
jgi:hypothetical protein